MPSIVYKYGVLQPDKKTTAALMDQIRGGHRYYNKLVEIARRRTESALAARREMFPDFGALEEQEKSLDAELKEQRAQIKRINAKERRKVRDPVRADKVKALKKELSVVREKLKEERARLKESVALQERWKDIDAAAKAEMIDARGNAECDWGTYLLIEASVEQATKKSHGMPRFRPWEGGGRVGVQLQGGQSVEELFSGQHKRLRVEKIANRERIDQMPRSHRLTHVWIRIGSNHDRSPKWARVPLIYHRPLPEDSFVKWFYLTCRRVGKRLVWEACFVMSNETGFPKDRATEGDVGIDVGWRMVENGLRVAYWVGSDEREGQLILPHWWLRRWEEIEQRKSERHKSFNAARDHLAYALEHWGERAPEWIRERTKHLRQWNSADRLWHLIHDPDPSRQCWSRNRFSNVQNEVDQFEWLMSWWKEERKAHDSIAGATRRLLNQREEWYRQFAVEMRRSYKMAHVESLNWARMQKNPEPEEEEKSGALKFRMGNASVGKLLELLKYHMAEVVGEIAADTTRRCQDCGFVRDIDGTSLIVECENCGKQIDQDRRAAINLLRGSPLEEKVMT